MHASALPTEILLEFFMRAVTSEPFELGGSTVAIDISQVCGLWRATTLGYPFLWSDIRISSGSSVYKLEKLVSRCQLESSIAVAIYCSGRGATLPHHRSLLGSLLPCSHRIHSLSIRAPVFILNLFPRVAFATPWPCLLRLDLAQDFPAHMTPVEEVARKVPFWNLEAQVARLSAPRLHSLSLTALTPTQYLDFGGVKELHVQQSGYFVVSTPAIGPSYFRDLQTLNIASSPLPAFDLDVGPIDTRIGSLTLTNLRPADNPPAVLANFLSTLHMPALEHLAIHGLHGYLGDELVRWLAGAHYPSLRSVEFDSVIMAEVLSLPAPSFTSVERLRIVDGDVEFIRQILEGDSSVCPRVSEIDVGDEGKLWIRGRHILSTRCEL
ncbi:hypothetical protein FB45DRAFT_900631 [Roridomyces roridus]|uniref:F-box domain-containing protein n=1 Tax=Roridomyces roridus TaxID=1738132 RepID=A0AAD7C816_9AGAR|nr:hypothetical protein FB45DRAFT_900631 [Roridomyces roridus]